jgi:hypothetical protein
MSNTINFLHLGYAVGKNYQIVKSSNHQIDGSLTFTTQEQKLSNCHLSTSSRQASSNHQIDCSITFVTPEQKISTSRFPFFLTPALSSNGILLRGIFRAGEGEMPIKDFLFLLNINQPKAPHLQLTTYNFQPLCSQTIITQEQ